MNRLSFGARFTDLSGDRESLDVTENLRRQVDALSAENQRLRARFGAVSVWDVLAGLAVFAVGLFSGLRLQFPR